MYQGIKTSPFQYAVHEVAPPYAPESWQRPAPVPGVFTQVPSNLTGPIFPAPGWHVGPAVYAQGYGADDGEKTGWAALGTGTKVGIVAAGVLALGAIGLAVAAFMKPKAKTRANPRYKKYPFYVIRKSDGMIYAGFEYREDANEAYRNPGDWDARTSKEDSGVMTHAGVLRKYGKIAWQPSPYAKSKTRANPRRNPAVLAFDVVVDGKVYEAEDVVDARWAEEFESQHGIHPWRKSPWRKSKSAKKNPRRNPAVRVFDVLVGGKTYEAEEVVDAQWVEEFVQRHGIYPWRKAEKRGKRRSKKA